MKRGKETEKVESEKRKLKKLRGKVEFIKKHFKEFVVLGKIKNIMTFPFRAIWTYIKRRPIVVAALTLIFLAMIS